jgi:arabinan endo-1,5-alpha-L-arabinosidase
MIFFRISDFGLRISPVPFSHPRTAAIEEKVWRRRQHLRKQEITYQMNAFKKQAALCAAAMVLGWGCALPISNAIAETPPEVLQLEGDVSGIHDPVVIKEQDTYYLFCTGGRPGRGVIPIRISKDLRTWRAAGFALETLPAWATNEIPRARNAWAPDISHFNGKFHLYYSVSSFGSRNSAIGLATNKTLDPTSPDYHWVDEGLVLRSDEEKDDWNAIDPNIVIEDERNVWLSWGSFWSGIKMRRIDAATGKLSIADTTMHSLSSRPRRKPIDGSVEAPTIIRHGNYWYLFVSFDRCCRGAESTYKVVVGRSLDIRGPYLDKTGTPMMEGGGSVVIEATGQTWRGPGHQTVLQDSGADYLLFHAYDATTGRPHLQISTMVWEDGWPRVGALP